MKKRFLRLFSIIAVALLLSGCVKYNFNAKITSDKKMTLELIIATSKSLQGTGTGSEDGEGNETTTEEDDEELKKLKDAGWTVEEYEDDTYKGTKLKKTYDNIDEITTEDKTEYDLNALMQKGEEAKYMFYKAKGTNVYEAVFKASTNTGSTGEDEKKPEDMTPEEKAQYEQQQALAKQMMSSMDLKMNIEVPKVVSSNATTTDGNKLTWDLTKMEEGQNIEFKFELGDAAKKAEDTKSNAFPIIPVAIGGGVALLVVIILVVALSKKKKKVEDAPVAPVEPVAPVAPVAPVEPVAPTIETPVVPEPVPAVETPVEPAPVIETPVVETPVVETVAPTVEAPTEPVNTENNNL